MSKKVSLSKEELSWIYTALCCYADKYFPNLNESSKNKVRALMQKILRKKEA